MTRTAIYHASPGHIVEQPTMQKPRFELAEFDIKKERRKWQVWNTKWNEYNAHFATLRTIPCHESARSLWKDGQRVEEGKDYEVKECRTWTRKGGQWGCAECCWGDRCDEDCDATYRRPNCPFCKGTGWFKEQPLFAFPLPVKSENQLWIEVVDLISIGTAQALNKTDYMTWRWNWIDELKKHYSLSKR